MAAPKAHGAPFAVDSLVALDTGYAAECCGAVAQTTGQLRPSCDTGGRLATACPAQLRNGPGDPKWQ